MKSLITKSLWMFFFVLQGTYMYAQSTSVTGKVTDEFGETLPGVTILEKGMANGTTTGLDGIYSLDLTAPSSVLIFLLLVIGL